MFLISAPLNTVDRKTDKGVKSSKKNDVVVRSVFHSRVFDHDYIQPDSSTAPSKVLFQFFLTLR